MMSSEPPEWALIVARCLIDPIQWEAGREGEFPYQVMIEGRHWEIRVNDFPAEPLYTLMIDGQEGFDLEDWPALWKRPHRV
jgi:hypothetical protein